MQILPQATIVLLVFLFSMASVLANSSTGSNALEDADQMMAQGFFQQAINIWRSRYDTLPENSAGERIDLLIKIAGAQKSSGMYQLSIQTLLQANKISERLEDINRRPVIYASLGAAYLYVNDTEKSRLFLNRALQSSASEGNDLLAAKTLNDLGNVYAYEKNYELAVSAYQRCVELATSLGQNDVALKAYVNLLLLPPSNKADEQTIQLLDLALDSLGKIADSYSKALAVAHLVKALNNIVQNQPGFDARVSERLVALAYEQIRLTQNSKSYRILSYLYLQLGRLYELQKQFRGALFLTEKALFFAQQEDAKDLLYQSMWQAGRINLAQGDIDVALTEYRRAVDVVTPIRYQLAAQVSNGDNGDGLDALFRELTDILLRKSDQINDVNERSQYWLDARNVFEKQKVAELQDYFKDSCVVDTSGYVKTLEETIGTDTAVIYPILLAERTEVLVSFNTGIQRYTIYKTAGEVTQKAHELREELERLSTRKYLSSAQTLYQWLIADIEPQLQKHHISTLVFVADQSLRTIPFSVLHDGNQFLINKYAIATTPGLKLTDPRPLKREHMKVLLSGISEPVQGYPALTYVKGELEEIQDLYVSKMLLNRDFVIHSLSDALEHTDYSIAHIASHSEFTGKVGDSYILTYDGRITVNQLGKFTSLSERRQKPIELLTLSSCQTAAGDDRAALGLAGVAVRSGARNALATLWSINDQASSVLVTEFYRELLKDNVSKAKALQLAQIKLMQNVRYRHPGYWSPFLLIGNWM